MPTGCNVVIAISQRAASFMQVVLAAHPSDSAGLKTRLPINQPQRPR
jgi:hypothetical protein